MIELIFIWGQLSWVSVSGQLIFFIEITKGHIFFPKINTTSGLYWMTQFFCRNCVQTFHCLRVHLPNYLQPCHNLIPNDNMSRIPYDSD